MSGLNFIAFAIFPLIFILPYKLVVYVYIHESVLWVKFSFSHLHEVVVQHRESSINVSFFAINDFAYGELRMRARYHFRS